MKDLKMICLLVLALILFGFSIAIAGPFLVCDESPIVDVYLIVLDSGEVIETPAPLHYDLAGILEGDHIVEVQAKNKWGVSSVAPLEFKKELPLLPMNLKLLVE